MNIEYNIEKTLYVPWGIKMHTFACTDTVELHVHEFIVIQHTPWTEVSISNVYVSNVNSAST